LPILRAAVGAGPTTGVGVGVDAGVVGDCAQAARRKHAPNAVRSGSGVRQLMVITNLLSER
jgi:hypothetical protein